MRRREYEALYGGAAGGGKSDALLAEALRQVHIPCYRGLILRKTYPQLRELIDRSAAIYEPAFPGARYLAGSHCWVFPSGAKIFFGSMQHATDRTNYQGQSYDYIAFDELTHFTFEEYTYMFSRNRPTGAGTRVYMRAATNPGGIGHAWVRARFVDPAPPMSTIRQITHMRDAEGNMRECVRTRVFVPSTVFDNRILIERDPAYAQRLSMLPDAERKALLYGSWDAFSGQVFTEWRDLREHYADRLATHVIEPFAIGEGCRIIRGFDFGYAKPFSVGWYAACPDGMLYRIGEYYGCEGTPNVGIRLEPAGIASEIRRIENEDPNLRGRYIEGIADPSIFDESRGESVARIMEKPPANIYFTPGDNARLAGKMQVHNRLVMRDGKPRFQCFSTCRNFIRTLPALVYSTKHPEDIDTDAEDHIYDELRYVLMANPIAREAATAHPARRDDPLGIEFC